MFKKEINGYTRKRIKPISDQQMFNQSQSAKVLILLTCNANNKGEDQPVHMHRLISTFVIRYRECNIFEVPHTKISIFKLVPEANYNKACLNLACSQISTTGFLVTRPTYILDSKRNAYFQYPFITRNPYQILP